MRAAGFPVYGYKLAAFVIAGALAGLAGFLVASRDGVVNPELLAWHNSGEVLLMIILGGLGHLRGAVIGAVAFTLLKELLSTHALVGPLADHWQLTLGLAIIAFVALLPKGIVGIAARLSMPKKERRAGTPKRTAACCARSNEHFCVDLTAASAAWSRSTTSRWTCAAARCMR